MTDIVVFSTAPSVRLLINGKQIGKMEFDKYATAIFQGVKLSPGLNHVEVKTSDGGSDSADWTVK